jgi:glycosyltransferase involved in cell wall biosynthesis
VYDALAEIDVLLVPSAPHEATTRVILEAAMAGVPVVAFAVGGIPEVLSEENLARSVEEMARKATAPVPTAARIMDFSLVRYRAEIVRVLRSVGGKL